MLAAANIETLEDRTLLATITVPTDFATIQLAVNNASAGDEITVNNGTFTESVNLNNMGSAVGGGPGDITIRATNAGMATVTSTTGEAFRASAFSGDITIQDFVFDNTGGSTGSSDGVAEFVNVTGTVRILNNTFDAPISNSIAINNTGACTVPGRENVSHFQQSEFKTIQKTFKQIQTFKHGLLSKLDQKVRLY